MKHAFKEYSLHKKWNRNKWIICTTYEACQVTSSSAKTYWDCQATSSGA